MDDVDGPRTAFIVITGDTVDLEVPGEYVLIYTVADTAGNTTIQERKVTVYASRFYITNGEFDIDAPLASARQNHPTDWGWHGNTGTMTAKIEDGMAQIEILTVGTLTYGTQFYLLNRTVEQGKTYHISFRVRADIARPLQVVLENVPGGYVRQFDHIFNMTTEWQVIEFDHFQFNPTITEGAKLGFFAGLINDSTVTTTYYLDYVRVEEVPNAVDTTAPVISGAGDVEILVGDEFDPWFGVTISDNMDFNLKVTDIVLTGLDLLDTNVEGEYTLTYTLTDASDNTTVINRKVKVVGEIVTSSWVILNGDFSKEQLSPYPQPAESGWGWHGSGGSFNTMIKDGIAVIDIFDNGFIWYANQFYLQNRVITKDQIYKLSFRAKADDPRLLRVVLQPDALGFVTYYELTDEWTAYEFEYHMTADTVTNGKIGFYAGAFDGSQSTPTKIYLDDVKVELIAEKSADTTPPILYGIEDYYILKGYAFDPLLGVLVYDHYDKLLTVEDVVVLANTVNTDLAGDYTVTYEIEDASANKATYIRNVHVIEAEDAVASRLVLIDPNFDLETPVQVNFGTTAENANGWTLRGAGNGSFEFVDGRSGGKAAKVNITSVGTVWHAIQFHQRNIPLMSEVGSVYEVKFWAKADVARDIRINLEDVNENRTIDFKIVSLTTDWTEYTLTIRNHFRSSSNIKFGFFMGLIDPLQPERSALTSVYLDDVEVKLIGYFKDEVNPRIYAPDAQVAKDALFNPLTGIKYGDAAKSPTVVITSETVGLVTYDAGTKTYTIDTSVAGQYVLTYTVTDIHGNETVLNRKLTVTDGSETSDFTILNGDFAVHQSTPYAEPAVDGWGWKGNGSFNTEIKDGVAIIDVYDTWTLYYGTQFYMQNRTLTQGKSYLFSFKAKADHPRLLQMSLEATGMTSVNTYFELTTEWQTFTFEYTHLTETKTGVHFKFFAGNIHGMSIPTTVYLDDVVINPLFVRSADTTKPQIWGIEDYTIVKGNTFDPLAGLRVFDLYDKSLLVDHVVIVSNNVNTDVTGDYTVVYSLTDSSRNTVTYTRNVKVIEPEDATPSRIVILDADFDNEPTITTSDNNVGWTLRTGSSGVAEAAAFVDHNDGKAVKVTITNVGTIWHAIQFHQRNNPNYLVTEAGSLYRFTFWAKADVARDIRVNFEETTNNGTIDFEIIALTTEWTKYEVIFHNGLRSHHNVKIGFFMGLIDPANTERSVATSVYIDDVSIELLGYNTDTVAPRIYAPDATITKDAVFNPITGIKYGDNAKLPALVITSETVGLVTYADGVYTINTSVAGVYTLTYTVTDIYGNEKIHNRTLTIEDPVL